MDSNDGETSVPSASTSSSAPLSAEIRERIEKNRQAAKKRLLEKSTAVQEVLAAYKIIANLDDEDAKAFAENGPSSKKPKSAQQEKYERDLQNVASRGTVVRVQGTKLIDTGGGFLLEEKDLISPEHQEINLVREPAPIVHDVPMCLDCDKPFSSSFLLNSFDYAVCDACKDPEEKHRFITRTEAKNEYLLKDVDLDKREPILKFLLRPNPHNPRWGDMKLYLRIQVEQRALEVWESLERIQEQHEVREENRVKTKVKKFGKKMKALRMSARSSLYTRDLSAHEHEWGPESYNEDDDMYSHTCTVCSQVETYEKM